jgi:hypothetical protein
MSQEKEILFDEKELSEIITYLQKEISTLSYTLKTNDELIAFRDRIEKYLKKLKEFAKKSNASQFNILATIGVSFKVDVGLTFTLKD